MLYDVLQTLAIVVLAATVAVFIHKTVIAAKSGNTAVKQQSLIGLLAYSLWLVAILLQRIHMLASLLVMMVALSILLYWLTKKGYSRPHE